MTNGMNTLMIDSVGSGKAEEIKEIYASFQIYAHYEGFKVDTRDRCNVMSFYFFQKRFDAWKSLPVQLVSYSGDHIKTLKEAMFKQYF